MRLIENSPFENFKSNILELEAYEGPELKIKFKTMDGYLDFLKKIGTNPEYFEAMYLETLKSRHELSKARDPRAEIFRRIKAGLEKLKYKGELTFKSDLNKIAQAVWGKDVNESHLNFYLPDMIGIWDSDILRKNPKTIEGAIEVAMDELVDYEIFHKFKGFVFNLNKPVELLHYLISHLYMSLAGKIDREEHSRFSTKFFKIKTSGFPKVGPGRLDVELKMLPSYALEEFYYYDVFTVKDGFVYRIHGSIPKDMDAPGQAIVLRADKTSINRNEGHLDQSNFFKIYTGQGYDEIAEKIVKVQNKIETYFRCLTPDIFADND
jgi:hypothetical protein